MCLEIYQLNLAKFLSAPRFAWQAGLKKTEVKSELLTDIDMLLIVEKGTRGGIDMQNLIINIWKIAIKNKELSYLKYWDVNNLYSWVISQKLPVNDFKWVEDISEFDESFTKRYNEESDEGYFFEVDIYIKPKTIFHFQLKK